MKSQEILLKIEVRKKSGIIIHVNEFFGVQQLLHNCKEFLVLSSF